MVHLLDKEIRKDLSLLLTNCGHNTDLSEKQQKPDNVVLDNSPDDVPQQKVDHFTSCHTKIISMYGNLKIQNKTQN